MKEKSCPYQDLAADLRAEILSRSIKGLEEPGCLGEGCTPISRRKTPKQMGCAQGMGMEKLLIMSCYEATKGGNTQPLGILQAICHGQHAATT